MLRGRVVAGDCRIEPGRRPVPLALGRAAALSGTPPAECHTPALRCERAGILPGRPSSVWQASRHGQSLLHANTALDYGTVKRT